MPAWFQTGWRGLQLCAPGIPLFWRDFSVLCVQGMDSLQPFMEQAEGARNLSKLYMQRYVHTFGPLCSLAVTAELFPSRILLPRIALSVVSAALILLQSRGGLMGML